MPPRTLSGRDGQAEAEGSPGERGEARGAALALGRPALGLTQQRQRELKKNNSKCSLLRCASPPGWEQRKCIDN